jgi:hypothetical protein
MKNYIAVALVPGPQLGRGFCGNLNNPNFFDSGLASALYSNETSKSVLFPKIVVAGVLFTDRFLLIGCLLCQILITSQINLAGAFVFIEVLFM